MASNNAVEIEIKANTSGAVSEISKLGESAVAALLAADKLGLGFNTAMQKAQAGAEEFNRSLGGVAGNQAAISSVISAQNKFIELGQAAGLAGDKIAEMHAKFGMQISASAASNVITTAQRDMLAMGQAAGLTEEKMREFAASLGMSADQIAARFDKVATVVVSDFEKMAAAAGLPAAAIQKLNASFGAEIGAGLSAQKITAQRQALLDMGVAAGLSSERIAALRNELGLTAAQVNAHTSQVSASMARMAQQSGMSIGQLQNAMRMVPMQFTDIAVSLASGMPWHMVMMQQGGQLKDMFGSVGGAARAIGEYAIGLINPFTLAAAAVGALALAYNQGSKEADAYRLALVTTGNAAGVTTGQMIGMASQISGTVGTTGAAAEALAALASTGVVAGANMVQFATASIYAHKGLNQEVGETAKVFESLGRSPVEASAKLNEKLNYLTAATYSQIRAAMELGDREGAASIAQQAYAAAIEERGKKMIASMGSLERAWMGVAGGAKSAWDAMLNVGREEDPTAKAAAAAVKLLDLRAKLQRGDFGLVNETSARAAIQLQISEQEKILSLTQKKTAADNAAAKAAADNAALEKRKIDWIKEGDKYLTDSQKAQKEIARIRGEGLAAGAGEKDIAARVAAASKPMADKAQQAASERLKIENYYYKQLTDEVKSGEKLMQSALSAERSAGLIGEVDYFNQRKTLSDNALIDQQAAIELEIESIKRSGIAQKDKASQIAALNNQIEGLERERVAVSKQAEIDIAAAQRKAVQLNAANTIKDESEALEARYKLAMVKDADYYATAAQNTAEYQQEKANLALKTYLSETRYAVQGSQVEIDARQKMIKVVRDIGLERELANKNALASSYQYAAGIDATNAKIEYEATLIGLTAGERSKALAIYDIEIEKLQKIKEVKAATPEGKARDTAIAGIEVAAAKKASGEVQKIQAAQWGEYANMGEQAIKAAWDALPQGAGGAAQAAWAKIKKDLWDQLYKLAIQPIVLNVMASVTGQVSGLLGGGGAGGGVGGVLQQASSINNLIGGGGSAGMLASAGYGAALGTTSIGVGSQAAMLAAQTAEFGFAGAALTAEAAGATAAMSGLAGSIGALSAAAPWIAGGLMIANAVGLFGGDNNNKVGGTYQYTKGQGIDVWRDDAGRTRLGTRGDEIGDNLIQKGIQSAADNINKILEQIGSTSRVKSLTAGAQSSSEKPEAMVEAYGTLDTGRKFGIQGEQKLNKTASPEEVIKEYQTALNQATLEAIKQAADIPKSVKDMLQKVDPRGIENDKFNEYLARIISDAQAAITQQWTGMDVSTFGELMAGMANTSVGAAQYMSDGISSSIGGAWAGQIQAQFNNAMYTGVLQPIIMTATTAGMSSDLIKEQLGAAQNAIANMRSQLSTMKEVMQSDDFKGLMADIGSAMGEAQEPLKELQTYIPQTSGAVKSFADTASSASNSIADAAKKEADEKKGLQDKLDALTMTRAQLLAKEREAIGESNRALFDQLKAREALNAANELNKGELEKQASLAIDLMEARGDAEGALEARRGAAIRAATEGMNEANAELVTGAMLATNALEDQVNAASALRDVMVSLGDKSADLRVKLLAGRGDDVGAKALSREIELGRLTAGKDAAAKKEIEAAFGRNAKLEDQIELEAKLSSAMRDVEKLQKANAMDAIKLQKDVAKEQADTAKALMEVVRSARLQLIGETDAGAKMQADAAREFIRNAAEAARKTGYLPDEKRISEAIAALRNDQSDYASVAEETYAKMLVAGDLKKLEDVSKSTLDKAEAAQKVAEAQLAALEGGNAVALQAAQAAQNDAARQLTELVGIREALAAQNAIKSNMAAGGSAPAANAAQYRQAPVEYNAGLQGEAQALYGYLSDTLGAAGAVEAFATQIKGYGYTLAEAEVILGVDKGLLTDTAKAFNIPAFAAGANVIPQDMIALVHEGEAIIPAPFNPYLRGVGGVGQASENAPNNADMVAELKALRAELTRITALLENVTEGGNAMRTTAVS